MQVIDGRNSDQFSKASIFGSINIPLNNLLNGDKSLKSPNDRRQLFESYGIDLTKDIWLRGQGEAMGCILYGSLKDIATGRLSVL
jgi:3-mercaptopyruvate sulfurtransferase SseA